MGRAISYVQYMPKKPIKHGIKVFAICCGISAVLLGFKIYTAKLDQLDHSALEIVDNLIKEAGLVEARGRILYTDNWYTIVKLAIHSFDKYS